MNELGQCAAIENRTPMSCSVVICTDGRARSLANTLNCLQYLDGPAFEVCVVAGPTNDGTAGVLEQWEGRIKIARNPERNLSVSRNMGIAMAACEVIAFIDDDGLPEPEWLQHIIRAFDDPNVGGAGGIVTDHTGARIQYQYVSVNRLGHADFHRIAPAEEYNFPFSYNIPGLQGTNSGFRRDVLLAIGGFDEEFEYYLDETDVCCRLLDQGWSIRQLSDAIVNHKSFPSEIRTVDRILTAFYPIMKNKLYFSLINNRGHYTERQAIDDMVAFVQQQERTLWHHIDSGHLSHTYKEVFREDVDHAWTVGLSRGLSGRRRLMQPARLAHYSGPFLEFPRPFPDNGREVFVFVSQGYPPGGVGGISRHVHELARAVAVLGHHVHVLTRGEDHDRIDFEDGVWVHRLVTKPAAPPCDLAVPPHIWSHSATMLEGLINIANRRLVTAVHAPIWDCEGIAILLHGGFPLVTGLHTTLKFLLDSSPHQFSDASYQDNFVQPMLEVERLLLNRSDAIHANSTTIKSQIAETYGVLLDPARTAVIPHGIRDWTKLPATAPTSLPEGSLRLLFVGRLEPRKGIDVLLSVLPRLLCRHPKLYADIVGNDRIPGPEGIPYRVAFQAAVPEKLSMRVRFHGEVTEDCLRGFYNACDFLVAPSRFESFGLILVEAMMFGKPAVACRAGGMIEVAEDAQTALLAEPGDAASLEACVERLIRDTRLREVLGSAARQRYESRFAPTPMADRVVALMRQARAIHVTPTVQLEP